MRLTSTPLSADRGEISVLAIVESIIAISISLWIAWRYQTGWHIVVSACAAPFLLLRSKRSVTLNFIRAMGYREKIDKLFELGKHNNSYLFYFIKYIVLALLFFLVRIFTTIIFVIRKPFYSFEKIPFNWKRIVLCTDSFCLPEIIPGTERLRNKTTLINKILNSPINSLSLIEWIEFMKKNLSIMAVIQNIVVPLPLLTLFVMSLFYRLSLKSTAIIWSPLLWIVVRSRFRVPWDLVYIRTRADYRAMRIYSVFVAVGFAWAMLIVFGWTEIESFIQDGSIADMIRAYVPPYELRSWQLAAFTNAVLAWILYLLADIHLSAIEIGDPKRVSDRMIVRQLTTIAVLRHTLALYTALCMLYITAMLAFQVSWPPIEFIVFPWSRPT